VTPHSSGSLFHLPLRRFSYLNLAELAARYQQRTLSGFFEWAVTRALTPEVMQDDNHDVSEPRPLWMEGLWDVDEADRFFMLGTRPDLMTIEQQAIWTLMREKLSRNNRKFNRQQFRELWADSFGGTRSDRGVKE
jgi:hypothetical protein